jgi:hypothetical protein
MEKENDDLDRGGAAEDRRSQTERRGETRRRDPRYTPDGSKAPDRRGDERRRDSDAGD